MANHILFLIGCLLRMVICVSGDEFLSREATTLSLLPPSNLGPAFVASWEIQIAALIPLPLLALLLLILRNPQDLDWNSETLSVWVIIAFRYRILIGRM